MSALGSPAGPPPFPWHDRDVLERLFAPHGFAVATEPHSLAFTAASADSYLDTEVNNHPLAVAGWRILEHHGGVEAVRKQALSVLEAANEEPPRFRVTGRYIVATATCT